MPSPETPLLATDCVVLDDAGRVLLIRRKNEPYRGALALPGGFVEIVGVDADVRELTGHGVPLSFLNRE